MAAASQTPRVVIACGGTGGHFFPGAAVAHELREAGAQVTLLVSSKKVDRQAAQTQAGMDIREIPAVALELRRPTRFLVGFWQSMMEIHKFYCNHPPAAVLAMGGFTSAAPAMLGRLWGAPVFLHESNAIPGRANRFLAPLAEGVFVGFEAARNQFLHKSVEVTGTPVRPDFFNLDPADCREWLGLLPSRPVLLVMGGSQGARAINRMMCEALPGLLAARPDFQFLHLAGESDLENVEREYRRQKGRAVVRSFLGNMPAAIGAADVAVGRSGASSLAELAAAKVPAVLVPMPGSADDHQRHNARHFAANGLARVVEQTAGAKALRDAIINQLGDRNVVGKSPRSEDRAAAMVAKRILESVAARRCVALKDRVNQAMAVA